MAKVDIGMCFYDGDEIKKDTIARRVAKIRDGISLAFSGAVGRRDLRIFLAPEYFFRKSGFAHDERSDSSIYSQSDLLEICAAMEDLTRSNNLVLIPGTVFWEYAKQVHNSAPVFHQGKLIHLYNKVDDFSELKEIEIESGSEFVPGQRRNCLFDVGRYKFGIEICGDHSSGIVSRQLGTATLDFHIVIANRTIIQDQNILARRDRYYLYCNAQRKLNRKSTMAELETQLNMRVYRMDDDSHHKKEVPQRGCYGNKIRTWTVTA